MFMRMLRLNHISLFATLLSLLSANAYAISCDESKESLISFQRQQNEITITDGEAQKSRQQIEIERDKYLAQLMLLQGVEANIEAFENSLTEIRGEGENAISLADLLNGDDSTQINNVVSALGNHLNAVENIRANHALLGAVDSPQLLAFTNEAYLRITGLDPATRDENLSSPDQLTAAEGLWRNVQGDRLLDEFQTMCAEGVLPPATDQNDMCEIVNQMLNSGRSENRAHMQELVMGFFGLIKRDEMNPRIFAQGGEPAAQAESLHAMMREEIQNRIPSKVLANDGSFQRATEGLQQTLTTFNSSQAAIQRHIKEKATCRLQGSSADTCSEAHQLPAEVTSGLESAISSINSYIQDFATDQSAATNDDLQVLTNMRARLQRLRNQINITDENSDAHKLLNREEAYPVHTASENFKQYLDNANFLDVLMKRIKSSEDANTDATQARMLNELLTNAETGLGCQIEAEPLSEDAEIKAQFNQQMISCLMDLKSSAGQAKRLDLKNSLEAKVNELGEKLATIENGDTFKSLERLKKIAYNDYLGNCTNDQTRRCSSTDDSFPLGLDFKVLEFEAAGVAHIINLHNEPGQVSLGGTAERAYEEQEQIHDICQTAGGQNENPLCRSANERIEMRRTYVANERRRSSIRRNYTWRTLPDGSRVYRRRPTFWQQAGLAVAHSARSWPSFYGNYLANEMYADAAYNNAIFWKQYYSDLDAYAGIYANQVANLAGPYAGTFQFTQQPTTFSI